MPRPHRAAPRADEYSAPLRESVKVQKQLIRLKIFTPIAVLVNILVLLVASFVVKPNLAQLSDDYYTYLTPSNLLISVFWLVLFVLQLGYCLILLTAYKDGTLATLTSPLIGPLIPVINILFPFWALFFCLRYFIVSEAILLAILLLTITVYIGLLRHPAQLSRPFDYLFVHVPYRLLLVFLLNLDVLHNGLLALGWYHDPSGHDHPARPPKNGLVTMIAGGFESGWEEGSEQHSWIIFTVLLVMGLISDAIIFLTTDPIWALGTVYVYLALILKKDGGKPPQILIPAILLSILAVISLIFSFLWDRITRPSEGQIRLAEDRADAEAGLRSHAGNQRHGHAAPGEDVVDGRAYEGGLVRHSQDGTGLGAAEEGAAPAGAVEAHTAPAPGEAVKDSQQPQEVQQL